MNQGDFHPEPEAALHASAVEGAYLIVVHDPRRVGEGVNAHVSYRCVC